MEQFINTFEDGLRSNIDPNFQPENTYRYSMNGKIVNVQGSDYTWESVNGTKLSFSIPGKILVGHIDSPKKLFLFTVAYDNPYLCEIGYVEKITTDGSNTYTVLYCTYGEIDIKTWDLDITVNLGFRSDYPYITGYYNLETENIERLYWTDETTQPKVLNIAKLETVFTRDLLWGLQLNSYYMVLEGWAQPTGHSPYFKGYMFKHFTSFADASTDVKIVCINEARPEILPFNPVYTHPIMRMTEQIDGNLLSGTYYITCRMMADGYKTQFGPLTGPFSIFNFKDGFDWKNLKGTVDEETGWGMRFLINNIPKGFTKIEYALFKITSDGSFSDGSLFGPYDVINNSASISVINNGGQLINISNYIKSSIYLSKIKDLTVISKNSVVANICLTDLSSSSNSISGTVTEAIYEMPADRDFNKYKECNTLPNVDRNDGVASGDILPGVFYKVTAGTVGYNGVSYASSNGDMFVGVAGEAEYTGFSEGGRVFPVYRIPKYYDEVNGKQIFDDYVVKDALSYKGIMANFMAGYWNGETYRIGILPISLDGRFLPVRWLKDHFVTERDGSITRKQFNIDGTYTDTAFTTEKFYSEAGTIMTCSLNVTYLLVDVDLSDIIDEISGFCVVRSPRDKSIVSEGVVEQLYAAQYDIGSPPTTDWKYLHTLERPKFPEMWGSKSPSDPQQPHPGVLCYVSPGVLQDSTSHNLKGSESIKYAGSKRALQHNSKYVEELNDFYTSAYYTHFSQQADPGHVPPKIAPVDYSIKKATIIEGKPPDETDYERIVPENNPDVEEYALHNMIRCINWDYPSQNERNLHDLGGKYLMLEVSGNTLFNTDDACIHVYRFTKPWSGYYGGQNSIALQESQYIFTGHYQRVDNEFKGKISNGLVRQIGLFGGDCFLNIFSYQRIYKVMDLYAGDPDFTHINHVIKVPLHSDINSAAFAGEDIYINGAQYAKYNLDEADDTGRYLYKVSFDKYEEFIFNKSFMNEAFNMAFPGVNSRRSELIFKNRFYYSLIKVDGEDEDSYRIYLTNNYLDLDGRDGQINNVRSKLGRLFCFQEKAVNYIPVSERAIQSNEIGLPIQLGIGGRFERNDMATRTGNLFKLGLTETDDGFTWFDTDRKDAVLITLNLQEVEMALIGGVKNQLLDALQQRQITDVISGYDPFDRTIYMTITTADEGGGGKISKITISYNYLNKRFEGYHSIYPGMYIPFLSRLMASYIEGTGVSFDLINVPGETTLLGNNTISILKIIVGSKQIGPKRFISSVIKGTSEFFDEVTFATEYDYETNSFKNTTLDNSALINQHYRYVNGEWRFGIPQDGNLNMHEDSIMQIELKKLSLVKKIKIINIITYFNKRQ